MNPDSDIELMESVLQDTQAEAISSLETIQELWSGYGKIVRVRLEKGKTASLIAKHISLPEETAHPRGWNSAFAHQRKLRSYEVETEWYRNWSHRCKTDCRLPQFLGFHRLRNSVLLLLEDLDEAGFRERRSQLSVDAVSPCLEWLARFHGRFLGHDPEGLWKTGTYWHLETRPEEWKAISDPDLRETASMIDQELSRTRFQTLVHGDAKLANFCFSAGGQEVAMVDFQYVGGGCGMKDVAYFLGSCLEEDECEKEESQLLDIYFNELRNSVRRNHPAIDPEEVIHEWKDLYPVAWTDFHRFLMGWCPDHWKVNRYSQRLARQVIDRFQTSL